MSGKCRENTRTSDVQGKEKKWHVIGYWYPDIWLTMRKSKCRNVITLQAESRILKWYTWVSKFVMSRHSLIAMCYIQPILFVLQMCDNQVIILILVRVYVKKGEKNTTACLWLPPNFDPATPACLGLGLHARARNEPTTRLSTATVTTISNPWPGMAP